MHKTKNISDLLTKEESEYKIHLEERLKTLNCNFNILSFFSDSLNENAWTRIFSFFLNSDANHHISAEFFRKWISLLTEKAKLIEQFAGTFMNEEGIEVKPTTEWTTIEGRRLDLLLEVFNRSGKVIAVIGLENKVYSAEQKNQISDYQKAMCGTFPEIPKIILFCTPDERLPETAAPEKECPCFPISYSSFQRVCEYFTSETQGEVKVLLGSFAGYIEKLCIEAELSKIHTKMASKLANASRVVDYLLVTPFLNQLQTRLFDMFFPFNWFYSTFSTDQACVFIEDYRMNFEGFQLVPCYMFHFEKKNPGVGDKVVIRLMIHFEKLKEMDKEKRNFEISRFLKGIGIPGSSNRLKHWQRWINLWTSEAYKLNDLDRGDLNNLTSLLFDSIKSTYGLFESKLKVFTGVKTEGNIMTDHDAERFAEAPVFEESKPKINLDMKISKILYSQGKEAGMKGLVFSGNVTYGRKTFNDTTIILTDKTVKLEDELNKAVDDSDWDRFVAHVLRFSRRKCMEENIR